MKFDELNTYRVGSCLIIIGLISCVMGFISLMVAFHADTYHLNSTDTTIAILTLLVTLLIGWNIYQVIDIRGSETKMAIRADDLEKRIDLSISMLEKNISMNINTAIDMLVEVSNSESLEDRFVNYVDFFYDSNANDSKAVNTSILRIIRNIVVVVTNNGQNYSNVFINNVSNRLSLNKLKCFADAYSNSHERYDNVNSWVNNLMELIKKKGENHGA